MSSSAATLLVLLSAVLHAGWNAVLKTQRETRVSSVLILAVAALSSSLVAVVLPGVAFPNWQALGWALGSGLGEAAYVATLARALDASSLGVAYTVSRGGSLLLLWPLSVFWLGETVSAPAIVGAALVCVGLVFTSFERHASQSARGLVWAVACAGFIAMVYLGYKRALAAGAEPTALFALSLVVAVPLNAATLGARALPRLAGELRARPVLIVGTGIVCAASFLLFLAALHGTGAGRAATLRNTSVLFAHAFGWMSGHPPTRAQVIGGALVVLGALLLGAG